MAEDSFVRLVRLTAQRYGMDLSRPLVMVSGGPDSVALLRTLLEMGADLAVLHVDHGLRGEESRADAEFVSGLCGRLGVRCEVRHIGLKEGPNLQERAREERLRLARETAGRLGMDAIATGHTADDVAETVLLNLARGAGLRGLAGIPPVRGPFVRPLIERGRREVLSYLERLGQPYRTDPTNLVGKYARNRVRLEVMPVLERLHPGAARNIARAAALVREDLDALERLVSGAVEERAGEAVVRLERLEGLPEALRRHAVRRAYRLAAPECPLPDRRHVEEALALIGKREGTRAIELPGGVVVAARYGRELAFYRRGELPGEVELPKGEVEYAGWLISVREVGEFDERDAARAEVAYLDAEKGPYRVRLAREGDIIRPLGLAGRKKKVMRAMMDRKVPADVRRRTPVVVDGRERVAWVFLGEIGEEFGVGPETRRITKLEVQKIT